MTPEQAELVLKILSRLEPYFAADDIRPCRFCGAFVRADMTGVVVEHNSGCVVLLIRELIKTLPVGHGKAGDIRFVRLIDGSLHEVIAYALRDDGSMYDAKISSVNDRSQRIVSEDDIAAKFPEDPRAEKDVTC